MPNIAELLVEANIPEDVAAKIEEMFDQKLEEGIQHSVESRLEEAKVEWAGKQATLIESHLQNIAESWAQEQTELLESSIQQEVLEESTNMLRNFLGLGEVSLKESADAALTGQVTSLRNSLESIQTQLDEALNINEAQADKLEEYQRAEYFAEATDELSDHACDKIATVLESQTFSDMDAYKGFVDSLVEAYAPPKTPAATPENVVDNIMENTDVNNPSNPAGKAAPTKDQPMSLVEATKLSMQGKIK